MTNPIRGIGIKTFQELAKEKGRYGSVMFKRAANDNEEAMFLNAKKRRITVANSQRAVSLGEQTVDVVAGAVLFTDPDVSRFVNALAIQAILATADQLDSEARLAANQKRERFNGAFEIHSIKSDKPTIHFYLFYRTVVEPRIRQLHKALKSGSVPGMERFGDLGVVVGKSGVTKPYSRRAPDGRLLHGNAGNGENGFDLESDWNGYKIPIELPNIPQFEDYHDGNPALTTHLDEAANLHIRNLASLLIETEMPELATSGKSQFANELIAESENLGELQSKFLQHDHADRARVTSLAARLLNVTTIYDVQNTNSAEFWRTFK